MRFLLVFVTLLMASGAAFAQAALSPTQFRDEVMLAYRAQAPDASIAVTDATSFRATLPVREGQEPTELFFSVDNIYALYRNNPTAKDQIIADYINLLRNLRDGAADRIVAILRPRGYIDSLGAASGSRAQFIWRPFAGDLDIILAFDDAESIQVPPKQDILDLGVTLDEAWRLAISNLPSRMGVLQTQRVSAGSSLEYVTDPNGLALSALTLDSFCATADAQSRVYLAVDRNVYVQAPRTNRRALRALSAMAAGGQSGRFSGAVLGCVEGRIAAISSEVR